jgi:hypothetical protein
MLARNIRKNRNLVLVVVVVVGLEIISGVQSAGWSGIHFSVGTSCERAAPLAEKNAAARHHVLRSLISLHNEHRVLSIYTYTTMQGIHGPGSNTVPRTHHATASMKMHFKLNYGLHQYLPQNVCSSAWRVSKECLLHISEMVSISFQ